MPETIPAFSDGIMVLLLGEAYFTRSRLDQCLGASIEDSAPSERQAIASQSCSRAQSLRRYFFLVRRRSVADMAMLPVLAKASRLVSISSSS